MELMVDQRRAADVDGDAGRGAPAPVSRVEAGGMVSALGDVPQAGAVCCVEAGGSVSVLGDVPRAAAVVGGVDVGGLTDRELDERLAELGRERSHVEGLLAVAAAEKHRRAGAGRPRR